MKYKFANNLNGIFLLFGIVFFVLLFGVSCIKSKDKTPKMFFISDPGYQFQSDSFLPGSEIKMGISAAQSSAEDPLEKFVFSHSANGSRDTAIYTETLKNQNRIKFTYSVTQKLGSLSKGKDQFFFTVISKQGRVKQISLTTFIKYH